MGKMDLLLSFLPHVLVKNNLFFVSKNISVYKLDFLAAFLPPTYFLGYTNMKIFLSAVYRNGASEHTFSLLLLKGNHGNTASSFV